MLWLDKRRRLTLPKALLRELDWEIGDELLFECDEVASGLGTLHLRNPNAEVRRTSQAPPAGNPEFGSMPTIGKPIQT